MPAALLLAASALLVLLLASRDRMAAPGELAELPGLAELGELAAIAPGDAPGHDQAAPSSSIFSAGAAVLDTLGASVTRLFQLPERAAPYAEAIRTAEVNFSLPSGLLARLLYQESRFRPEIIDGRVASSAGAQGIAQFMPGTARELGIDPLDAQASIGAAARYLRAQFDRFGSWAQALAAYNWGPGNLQRKGLGAAPAETRRYVADILADVGLSA